MENTIATENAITTELCEKTAREEGWLPVGECCIEDFDDEDQDTVYSVVHHREPPFFNKETGEFANADSWEALVAQQNIRVFCDSYRIPEGLTPEAKVLAREFRAFVANYHDYDHMLHKNCTVFRSPDEQSRHEDVSIPENAVMAVIFDGGPFAQILNPSYEDYRAYDAAGVFFKVKGYWFEHQTHWWMWVYKDASTEQKTQPSPSSRRCDFCGEVPLTAKERKYMEEHGDEIPT